MELWAWVDWENREAGRNYGIAYCEIKLGVVLTVDCPTQNNAVYEVYESTNN